MKLINLISVAAGALSPLAVATESSVAETPTSGVYDPFTLKNDDHLTLRFEALYWKTFEEGLSYGIKNTAHERVQTPHFDWNWGGRGTLAYKFPSWDKWDLQLSYTYFHATSSASSHGDIFPSLQTPQSSTVFATSAKFHGVTILNASEFMVGRTCKVSRWLTFRPSMGVKGVAIHQHFRLHYAGGTAVAAGDTDLVYIGGLYWGLGPRFALDSLWGLGRGFSIFANGAGSLVTGRFFGHQKDHLDVADITQLDVRNNESVMVPIAELALGFQWDKMMANDRYHLGLKLGFEMQYFFDQNRTLHFNSASNPGFFSQDRGDLAFMGVTFGFQFDF